MTATETITPLQRFDVKALAAKTTDELWEELAEGVRIRAEHLRYLAALWSELDSRGEDMSRLRGGACSYLPLIASGAVLPDVVERYLGKPACRAIASLPIAKQQELIADDAAVPLAVYQDSTWTHRRIPVNSLTKSQVELVFDNGAIRSQSEQVAMLTVTRPLQPKRKAATVGRVTVANGVVRIGRAVAPIADVVGALRAAGEVE